MNAPSGYPWSASEAATVNEFLNSAVGRKWIGLLLYRKPVIDVSSTERAAMTGSYSAGYERVFHEIAASRLTVINENVSMKAIDPTRD